MHRALLAGVIAVMTIASPSFARDTHDPAFDDRNQPIIDSSGKCVRTKWQQAGDPCLPGQHAVVPVEPAPVVMPEVSLEQRTIYFEFDSAVLLPTAKEKLDYLADVVNSSSAIADVRIHGYTDQIGTNSYNAVLANKRANSVKTYMDSKSRLSSTVGDVRGIGKSEPTAECRSIKDREEKIACMAPERRVEIEFKAQK